MGSPGYLYARLADAVSHRGTPRSVYSQDTTLSRRGLLTRADRRARELASFGVRRGELVALSMGNVVDLLVLLLAVSKLEAVAAIVDASAGDRALLALTDRLPVRLVVRRPRGQAISISPRHAAGPTTPGAVDYSEQYQVVSRRRLPSSLLSVDVLTPPDHLPRLADGTQLVLEARGIGGTLRDVVLDGPGLAAVAAGAASMLDLHEGVRLVSAQPLTVPRIFVPVVLGWLASEAQLVMADGPALPVLPPLARANDRVTVVDSVRRFTEMARKLKASGSTVALRPVLLDPTAPTKLGRVFKEAFGDPGHQLLLLEELGVLGSRALVRGATFSLVQSIAVSAGAPMETGGHEILAAPPQGVVAVPPIPETHPGAMADARYHHTGYAGRFSRAGELTEVLGRDDGLVDLDGRRACLDQIEDVLLRHRRLTWVRAFVETLPDGDPELRVEYRATGQTDVEDLEEHAIGELPPHMVPRALLRRAN